jgi:16S rRNA (uracil1498-N3)-methyltransferase
MDSVARTPLHEPAASAARTNRAFSIIARMHEPWFFCPALHPGAVELDDVESRHAGQVLRLRPGAAITLFDGQGHTARATLLESARKGKRANLVARVEALTAHEPPPAPLTLLTAACKGDRLDWLVEKCTELGVARLIFAEFEHSVVHLDDRSSARLTRTALAACKQSHRPILPQFVCGQPLSAALAATEPHPVLYADLSPAALPLGEWLTSAPLPAGATAVVGPEGGLSASEQTALAARGTISISLGINVLRVETAALAIAAAWAVHQHPARA